MLGTWRTMGVLRNLLHLLAFLLILTLPFSEPSWNPRGWDLLLNAVIPATTPILFVVLMFDTLMSAVWRSDNPTDEARTRLTRIIRFQLALGAFLMALWIWIVGGTLFL